MLRLEGRGSTSPSDAIAGILLSQNGRAPCCNSPAARVRCAGRSLATLALGVNDERSPYPYPANTPIFRLLRPCRGHVRQGLVTIAVDDHVGWVSIAAGRTAPTSESHASYTHYSTVEPASLFAECSILAANRARGLCCMPHLPSTRPELLSGPRQPHTRLRRQPMRLSRRLHRS